MPKWERKEYKGYSHLNELEHQGGLKKSDKEEEDYANQPHYTRFAIQPFAYIDANDFEFWRGSGIKYVSRAGHKRYASMTAEESELADCKKALWFLQKRIETLQK